MYCFASCSGVSLVRPIVRQAKAKFHSGVAAVRKSEQEANRQSKNNRTTDDRLKVKQEKRWNSQHLKYPIRKNCPVKFQIDIKATLMAVTKEAKKRLCNVSDSETNNQNMAKDPMSGWKRPNIQRLLGNGDFSTNLRTYYVNDNFETECRREKRENQKQALALWVRENNVRQCRVSGGYAVRNEIMHNRPVTAGSTGAVKRLTLLRNFKDAMQAPGTLGIRRNAKKQAAAAATIRHAVNTIETESEDFEYDEAQWKGKDLTARRFEHTENITGPAPAPAPSPPPPPPPPPMPVMPKIAAGVPLQVEFTKQSVKAGNVYAKHLMAKTEIMRRHFPRDSILTLSNVFFFRKFHDYY